MMQRQFILKNNIIIFEMLRDKFEDKLILKIIIREQQKNKYKSTRILRVFDKLTEEHIFNNEMKFRKIFHINDNNFISFYHWSKKSYKITNIPRQIFGSNFKATFLNRVFVSVRIN
jgi:hypothetical protein